MEPGNAIVASPFSFYRRSLIQKKIGDSQIIVTDGSRNDVDPFFGKKTILNLSSESKRKKCSLIHKWL